jgi:hypothetical protein
VVPSGVSLALSQIYTNTRSRSSTERDNPIPPTTFTKLTRRRCITRQSFPHRAHARFAVADYIEVFGNRQRLHSALG